MPSEPVNFCPAADYDRPLREAALSTGTGSRAHQLHPTVLRLPGVISELLARLFSASLAFTLVLSKNCAEIETSSQKVQEKSFVNFSWRATCEQKVNNISEPLCANDLRCEWLFTAPVNNFPRANFLKNSHPISRIFSKFRAFSRGTGCAACSKPPITLGR